MILTTSADCADTVAAPVPALTVAALRYADVVPVSVPTAIAPATWMSWLPPVVEALLLESVSVAFWSMYALWLVNTVFTAKAPAAPMLLALPTPAVASTSKLDWLGASTLIASEPAVTLEVPLT